MDVDEDVTVELPTVQEFQWDSKLVSKLDFTRTHEFKSNWPLGILNPDMLKTQIKALRWD